jgi:hypothetical protein
VHGRWRLPVCTREYSTLPIKVFAVLLVPSSTPPAQQLKPFSTEQRTIIVVCAVQATSKQATTCTLLLLCTSGWYSEWVSCGRCRCSRCRFGLVATAQWPALFPGRCYWLAGFGRPGCSQPLTVPVILLCFADVRTVNRLEEALYAFLILIV